MCVWGGRGLYTNVASLANAKAPNKKQCYCLGTSVDRMTFTSSLFGSRICSQRQSSFLNN